jgi:hypothetical protein
VIGADQSEGVHCLGPCNLYNVWFEDVCEDAITIKQKSGTSNIVGVELKTPTTRSCSTTGAVRALQLPSLAQTLTGSCRTRQDRLVLRSGLWKALSLVRQLLHVGFPVFAPAPCLTWELGSQYKRTVAISNVIAKNGKLLAGVNSNYGDVATITTSSNSYTSLKSVCDTFQGNNSGKEPTTLTKNTKNASYVSHHAEHGNKY